MRQALITIAGMLLLVFFMPVIAGANGDNPNTQCEMIAALTGDYYANKQAGLSKEETRAQGMPEFANDEFLRTVDLAISMAYAFEEGLSESEVEKQVYDECLNYQ